MDWLNDKTGKDIMDDIRRHKLLIQGKSFEIIERVMPHVVEFTFNYSDPVIPCSNTHTMHIDHHGKVTYNDLLDKVRAPQVYG